MTRPASYAKALVGAAVPFLGVLTAAAAKDGISLVEWLTAASAAVVGFGGVYGISNKP